MSSWQAELLSSISVFRRVSLVCVSPRDVVIESGEVVRSSRISSFMGGPAVVVPKALCARRAALHAQGRSAEGAGHEARNYE